MFKQREQIYLHMIKIWLNSKKKKVNKKAIDQDIINWHYEFLCVILFIYVFIFITYMW